MKKHLPTTTTEWSAALVEAAARQGGLAAPAGRRNRANHWDAPGHASRLISRLTRFGLSAYRGLKVPPHWDSGFVRAAPAFT